MPEYAWTEFWICLKFWIRQDSEYAKVTQCSKYVTIMAECVLIECGKSLNISEFTIIDQSSEYVSHNTYREVTQLFLQKTQS